MNSAYVFIICLCCYYWSPLCVFFFFFLMIRRPPRSTLDRSSAASDVYKRQGDGCGLVELARFMAFAADCGQAVELVVAGVEAANFVGGGV